MLAAPLCAWDDLTHRQAITAMAAPYLIWITTVGRFLWNQLGHLV